MGFHKRYINNEQVVSLYKDGGFAKIKDWYTKGVDAIILETGLASEAGSILSSNEWHILGAAKQEEEITKIIQQHLSTVDIKK